MLKPNELAPGLVPKPAVVPKEPKFVPKPVDGIDVAVPKAEFPPKSPFVFGAGVPKRPPPPKLVLKAEAAPNPVEG